jgi:ubiquitin carboxyl-terminal hydrolase 5/13
MACDHLKNIEKELFPPKSTTTVYKDECIYCFATSDSQIYLCLQCYQGFCLNHCKLHVDKTAGMHSIFLKVHRRLISSPEEENKPLESLRVEPEKSPEYEYRYAFFCFPCQSEQECSNDEKLVQAVHSHLTAKKASEIKAWEEGERQCCSHTFSLKQVPLQQTIGKTCSSCELSQNLWLCLTCGSIGCGRRQFDGSGGNGHAAAHFEQTSHPISVKLGTISPEGDADLYCYTCDDMRCDSLLSDHLAVFGIEVAKQQKTEATVAELQLIQNQSFDFKLTDKDGKMFKQTSAFPGIINNGNFCYISSVVQLLSPTMSKFDDHFIACSKNPAKCPLCQTLKVLNGLNQINHSAFSAWMFKNAIGAGHPEFATLKQQDASEFAQFWISTVEQQKSDLFQDLYFNGNNLMLNLSLPPSSQSVELLDLLRQENVKFHNIRKYLLIAINRITIENWVPKKLNTPLHCPIKLDLSEFKGGPSKEASFDSSMLTSMGFDPFISQLALEASHGNIELAMNLILEGNYSNLNILLDAGFPPKRAQKALAKSGNDAEKAMNLLLTSVDDEISSSNEDTEISSVGPMKLVGFVSHRGSSMHCGHYVCHAKKTNNDFNEWILFNDDKAVIVPEEKLDTSMAYLVLYQKED